MFTELIKAGFHPNEAKIYLVALRLGSAPASLIAQKAGMSRGNTYLVLDNMLERGYLTKIQKNKMAYFQPISPNRLLGKFSDARRQIDEQEDFFQKLLPSLNAIAKTPAAYQTDIEFFEGRTGFIQLFEKIFLSDMPDYYGIWDPASMIAEGFDANFWRNDFFKGKWDRVAMGKEIITDTKESREFIRQRGYFSRQTKFLPKEHRLDTEFLVSGNKFCTINTGDGVISGVILTNEYTAKSFITVFETLWGLL